MSHDDHENCENHDEHEDHVHLPFRARRLRKNEAIRAQVRETYLQKSDFIQPLFVEAGKKKTTAIPSMPGQCRYTPDVLLTEIGSCIHAGIQSFALFPAIEDSKKDPTAKESRNPKGLYPQTIRMIKDKYPDVLLYTDVAMDPYSSHGHDGYVHDGKIDNDKTIEILCHMAMLQSEAGADFVAPSDMMDGRVGAIRETLDHSGYSEVGILSYCAKYASSFYGPFREALGSAPKKAKGIPTDKKTYQMDPANRREALREAAMDMEEGADILMVKPALAYLDVIADLKNAVELPIAAYQVSGEYAMIMAAAKAGWLDEEAAFMESLLCIKRAGAKIILSYYAKKACGLL